MFDPKSLDQLIEDRNTGLLDAQTHQSAASRIRGEFYAEVGKTTAARLRAFLAGSVAPTATLTRPAGT